MVSGGVSSPLGPAALDLQDHRRSRGELKGPLRFELVPTGGYQRRLLLFDLGLCSCSPRNILNPGGFQGTKS